jgi:hypothetical protein
MNAIGLLFVAAGLFAICGALFNWDFFMNARRARFFVTVFGRQGARICYGLIGSTLVILGSLIALGIVKTEAAVSKGRADYLSTYFGAWYAPVWTMCMGALLGLIGVALVCIVARLISRPWGEVVEEAAFDGLVRPVLLFSLIPAALAVITAYWAPWRPVLGQLLPEAGYWPAGPDGLLLLQAAGGLFGLYVAALVLRLLFPKVTAVAQTTAKEGLGQPLFWVCLSLGVFLMLFYIWWPYNTFGEDIKMLKMQGLELLMAMALLLAVATASVSVSQEIEGRTALTVLSKPIGRRQFIIGKFLGVVTPVFVLFLVLGFVFLCTISYKVVYDALEFARPEPITGGLCREEVVKTVPGLLLKFMGATLMAATSVAISTRLPMLANVSICFAIYIVGHLMPMLVESPVGQYGSIGQIVQFMGHLIATVLPALQNFDVQAGIAGDQTVPAVYLLNAAVYGLCYCLFVLFAALFLFEDRDLA